MSSNDNPEWASGDPQQWETYWRACYQIVGAKAVIVLEHCRRENEAVEAAKAAMTEALEAIAKHGVKVEASCWTVKHQSRRQRRDFPATNTETFVTGDWHGRFTVILKSLTDRGETR